MSRIKADEFKVTHRKFFIFNIRPFNEVSLTNARVELYLHPEMPEMTKTSSSGASMLLPDLINMFTPDLKGLGVITRGVINDLIIKIYRSDRLCSELQAREAHIDIKRKEIELIEARIQNISSREQITSRSITWSDKEKSFTIPGLYLFETFTGSASGKGVKLDLDFLLSPLL
ncbi:hypothetical protein ACFL0H_03660 [Thermodesulfobacteriota bacterium]